MKIDEQLSTPSSDVQGREDHPVVGDIRQGRDEYRDRGRDRGEQSSREESVSGGRSLRNMGRMFPTALRRQQSGEYMNKIMAEFGKVLNPEVPVQVVGPIRPDQYKLMPMESSQHFVSCSAIVLMLQLDQRSHGDGHYLFTYTFLLAGSTLAPAPLQEHFENRPYDAVQVVGDYWNKRFAEKVRENALAYFPNEEFTYRDAGAVVIPAHVDPNTAEGRNSLSDYLFYATMAITENSNKNLNWYEYFGLDMVDSRDNLEVAPDFSGTPILNAAGDPRRTDVKLTLTATMGDDQGSYRQPLTVVGGQMEMIYSPPELTDRRTTQHLFPMFNITTWDTLADTVSLELLMLGLASTSLLTQNLFWVNVYRYGLEQRGALRGERDRETNLKELGALALLINEPAQELNTANTSQDDFMRFLSYMVHRDLAFGMHIEERGELSWIHSVLQDAAFGDIDQRNLIFDACDNLTDNHFSRIFKDMGGVDAVIDDGNPILLGTYKDERGQLHDLRDFDMLAWLCLTGSKDQALRYQDTFDQKHQPEDYRLERRMALLTDRLGNNINITGRARQVVFDLTFLAALSDAVAATGRTMVRTSVGSAYNPNMRQHGNMNIARFAGRDLGSNLYTYGRAGRGDDRGAGRRPYSSGVRRSY